MISFKRLIYLFILTVFMLPISSYSQRIIGGLSAGINLSQVDGDEIYGFHKIGFNGGPSVMIPFGKNKKWSVTLELLYSQKGSHQNVGSADTAGQPRPYYYLILDYAEVPVLVHFTDKKVIAGGIGFSYGQLVNHKEIIHGIRVDSTILKKNDISVIADVRIRLWQRLWIDARYTYSMFKIATRNYNNSYHTWDRNYFNNVISIRFTYLFNEEVPGKSKKKPDEVR
jgi:hypothetical protein